MSFLPSYLQTKARRVEIYLAFSFEDQVMGVVRQVAFYFAAFRTWHHQPHQSWSSVAGIHNKKASISYCDYSSSLLWSDQVIDLMACRYFSSHLSTSWEWDVRPFAHGAMGRRIKTLMVDLLNYFSFQPVLHDRCNKDCGMCYPVCMMVHIKEPLLLIREISPCSGGSRFPITLSEWLYHMSNAI